MVDDCGLCGSANVYSGSWTPSKCRDCGAIEGSNEVWYKDSDSKQKKLGSWYDRLRSRFFI